MHDESTSNHFENGSRPLGWRLLEMLYLPRRIYNLLKGNVDAPGREKKARITNNFACIKTTSNRKQSVDRMIHWTASGNCLRELDNPPSQERLKVSWNGVLLQMNYAVCFGHLWGHFTHMTRHFSFGTTETVHATRQRKQLCRCPLTKDGTKTFESPCCRAATASAVIAFFFFNYSFFTKILWIHIKFYSCYNLITDGREKCIIILFMKVKVQVGLWIQSGSQIIWKCWWARPSSTVAL